MNSPSKGPPFIVFYSFKGGVGRSMALINVAAILAGRGRRVLAIDLDLEAPGISYLLKQERGDAAPGFIDLLLDFFLQKSSSAIALGSNPTAFLDYTRELPVPKKIVRKEGGILRIMPAGKVDSDYEKRRQKIDLHRLYEDKKGQPLMARLREVIVASNEFDYVLIDSRTGFSDEAGISIRDLGDHLFILHGLNRQNIEGTARFVEQLRRSLEDSQKMEIEFVASPIPFGEDDLCEERIKAAENRFEEVWGKPVRLRHQIPYHPRLALDEEPAIFRRTQGALYDAYMGLEERVRSMSHDTAADWSGRAQAAIRTKDNVEAIRCFREADQLGGAPEALISSTCYEARGESRFYDYWRLLEEISGRSRYWLTLGINHFERLKDHENVEKLYRELVQRNPDDGNLLVTFAWFLRRVRNRPDESEKLLRRAVELEPKNGWYISGLATLLWRSGGRSDEAEKLYRHAVLLDPKDSHTISLLATFLWYERHQYDQAEELFQQALDLDPEDYDITGRFANFLWLVRGKYLEADRLYLRALAVRPDDGRNLCNYAGFLLSQKRLRPAEQMILRAWAMCYPRADQITAEVAFYRGLQLRSEHKPDGLALSYLRHLFDAGFPRMLWSFDEVLRFAGEKLSADTFNLYRNLAHSILDADKVAQLRLLPQWKEIKAQPLRVDI